MTGSLVLDRRGARDEHRDDPVPKSQCEAWASATGLCWLRAAGLSGWEDPPFGLAACKMRLWAETTFAVRTRASGSLGLSFYRWEPWVRNAVIYAVSKKWTATSALIFSAVLLLKNQPWAQRRAVAAKGI